jgi:TolA-binding protein
MMRMHSLRAAVLALCCVAAQGAHAQLFGDDQARQAILDLRQRFDQAVAAQNRLVDDNAQMRRSMLDLQQQIESLRGDLARSRGQEEQLTRDISELKKAQADSQRALDERLRKMETVPVAGGSPVKALQPRSRTTTLRWRCSALAISRALNRALPTSSNATRAAPWRRLLCFG